jgi:hypothetical protein
MEEHWCRLANILAIRHLGLVFDDMSQAMAPYAQYQDQPIFPQVETF